MGQFPFFSPSIASVFFSIQVGWGLNSTCERSEGERDSRVLALWICDELVIVAVHLDSRSIWVAMNWVVQLSALGLDEFL